MVRAIHARLTTDEDYQSYVRALQDTTVKWNAEFKSFLDVCQDVEEERQEFLKTNLWGLANAISSICVTDDEACERVRVSLESCDALRDVENFAREFTTGSMIPVAPEYINYALGQAPPQQPPAAEASFQRLSTRGPDGMQLPSASMLATQRMPQSPFATPSMPPLSPLAPNTPAPAMAATVQPAYLTAMSRTPPPPQQGMPPPQNISPAARTPPPSTADRNSMFAPGAIPLAQSPQVGTPYIPAPPSPAASRPVSQYGGMTPVVPAATMPDAMPAAPAPVPAAAPAAMPAAAPAAPAAAPTEDADDPIAKALANLRLRQNRKSPAPQSRPTSQAFATDRDLPSVSAAPAAAPAAPMGFDPRLQRATSQRDSVLRPTSPAAAFMQQPQRATSPVPVEQVMHHYGQAFPAERRSAQSEQARATSPLGVTLDERGGVAQDAYRGAAAQPMPAPAPPAPAPTNEVRPPTGQYSEGGEPILFYVKALYDYTASMPEEFSFTAGDIIAVTHTEPDGWWQGELLDEARRVPNANTFPSNFVVLLM